MNFRRTSALALCALLGSFLAGCTSGGSSGSGSDPAPSPSFTISLSASTLAINDSGGQTVTVTLNPSNGFNSTVPCTVSGLPSGVNMSPPGFSVSGAAPQQFQLTLNNVAVSGSATVTVLCSAGGLSAEAQFTLTLQVAPGLSLTLIPSSLSFDPGDSQSVELGINGLGGVTGNVTGSVTGLPAGISAGGPNFTGAINTDVILNFAAASTATTSGSATISVTNGTVSASATLPITVSTSPDFTLSSGIFTGLGIYQNATAAFTLQATPHNGFDQPIAISFPAPPSGITFSPATFTMQPGTAQNVQVTSTFAVAANSTPTVTVSGTGGGITHQIQFNLVVLAAFLTVEADPSPPNPLTVAAGSTSAFILFISASTNGAGTINVQLATPPSGVKIFPMSFTTAGNGGEASIFVETASNATSGTLTATATDGPLNRSLTLALIIGPPESITAVPLSTSDQLVRTDALTPYAGFPAPNYLVYHAATNRFFSTDAYLNQLNVIDAASHALTNTITIPGAFGLDQAPDGSVLYVGTMLGDLYVVDPVGLKILKRYASSAISSYGFPANAVYALANGKLLLEQYGLVPGLSWVGGSGPLALWDPSSNDITVFNNGTDGQIPEANSCLPNFENAILTNNRTRVLLSPVLTSEGSSSLCSLDPNTGTWNLSGQISGGQSSALVTFALSSDGATLVAYDGYDIYMLDAATLEVKSSFAVPTRQIPFEYPVMLLSQDNGQVFISDPNGADVLDVYELATGKEIGWIPSTSLAAPGSYTQFAPLYQALTPSGLAAGVIEGGGIGLLDTTAVHALPVGSRFNQTQLDVPRGPASGGTPENWSPDTVGVPAPPLGSVYFGPIAASGLNNDSFPSTLGAISPAGTPGPVDVRTFATDGGSQFLPDGFSYGPWVQEAPTSYATAEGGGPADLFGFGFGPQVYVDGTQPVTIPADLQVTVGGASARVDSYSPNPYGNTYFTPPPFPTNALVYTVPAGIAGTTAAITVNNLSGSNTASTSMTYLPALVQYSVNGELADGVYDSKRDVYYFSDATQVRVFSLTQGIWLAPIPIPAPQGAYGPQRLFGLAISPDGSKLAISDPGAIAIYIVDLDQPSSIQSFPFASQIFEPITEEPSGVAITNGGTVYFATFDLDGDGGSGYLYSLNPATGQVGEVMGPVDNPSLPTQGPDSDGRLVISADGSRVYFNDDGELGYVDTASGQFVLASTSDYYIGEGGYELVVDADQASFFADGFLTDGNLNSFAVPALDLAESLSANYVYGAAFSADGSLLFQPGTQSIDAFNGQTGAFRARISLPVQLSPNFRALVSNNQDSRLVAITGSTGNGIAVINLSSLPEPAQVSYLSAIAAPIASQAQPRPAAVAAPATGERPPVLHLTTPIHSRRSPLLDSLPRQHSVASRVAQPSQQ
jgi:hypothetical protein